MKTSGKTQLEQLDKTKIVILLLCLLSGIGGAILVSVLKPLESIFGLGLSLLLISGLVIVILISWQKLEKGLQNTSSHNQSFYEGMEYLAQVLPYRAVLLDNNGNYQKIVKAHAAIDSGASIPQDLEGKSLSDVMDKDVANYILRMVRKAIAENTTQVVEYDYIQDNKLFYLEGHAIPLPSSQSSETHVLWISRDITQRKAQEQKLINDELRLRSIASALPDRTVILTAEGRYYDVLKIDYETAPISISHQPEGRKLHELFDKSFADFCLAKVQETIENDKLLLFEYPYEDNDKTYYLEGRTVPYTDIITGEKRVIWISRDISERKKQEQALLDSQKLLRTITGVFPDRTLIFNREGQYQDILKAEFEASETPDEFISTQAGEYIHDRFPKEFADFCIQIINKTLDSGEMQIFEYVTPNLGNEYIFEGRTIPFKDPISGEERVLWVTRNISLRKEAEQQRLELVLQKEKLEFFRDFVNNMTHDLRTPLSVIETSLYLMERYQEPEKQQEKFELVRSRVKILTQMIDDMLATTQLDKIPQLELNALELVDLIKNTLASVRLKAEHKKQVISFACDEESIMIKANKNELRRALTNLIDNAIKYTPDKGQIKISVSVNNSDVVIKIQDSGIGISETAIPHIFERFYRGENGRYTAHGTGLGLTITEQIIKLHGGNIEVKSKLGQGSTFSVRLPVYQSAYAG